MSTLTKKTTLNSLETLLHITDLVLPLDDIINFIFFT